MFTMCIIACVFFVSGIVCKVMDCLLGVMLYELRVLIHFFFIAIFTIINTGNYAHGKHELKFRYTTLRLMESSGQIVNANTYLARPCMTWVSTGAW